MTPRPRDNMTGDTLRNAVRAAFSGAPGGGMALAGVVGAHPPKPIVPEQPALPSPLRLAIVAAIMASLGFGLAALLTQVGGHYLALPADVEAVTYTDLPDPAAVAAGTAVASAETPATPARPVARPRAANTKSYDVIVRRNIFDSTAVYNPAALTAGGGDCRDSSVKLIATMVADVPEYSSALLSLAGGKDSHAQGFVIGDEVAGEGRRRATWPVGA